MRCRRGVLFNVGFEKSNHEDLRNGEGDKKPDDCAKGLGVKEHIRSIPKQAKERNDAYGRANNDKSSAPRKKTHGQDCTDFLEKEKA